MEKRKDENISKKEQKRLVGLRTSYQARETVPLGDKNTLPSETEPDQTLTIKQLIERHVNGIDMGVQQYEPLYIDGEVPNFELMEFDELHGYREYLSNERFRLEGELKERQQEEKQRYLKELEEKRLKQLEEEQKEE